jgi:assimilatory nitrate reductase catalytic subunit
VARRIEARRSLQRTLFPYDTAESIWNEHRESTRGRDLDITGLSYSILEHAGPQQWPFAQGSTRGATRLYSDSVFPTADGRATFSAAAARPTAEKRDAHYPFSLTTGRLRDQWHGASRTGTLGRLFGHASEPVVELHPTDLARLRLNSGDLVTLKTRRGSIVLPSAASESVATAQAFVAMHWGSEFMAGPGVNALTTGAFCPQSKQPELKHAAVKLSKAELPYRVMARAWLDADQALTQRAQVLELLSALPYAACIPFGREPDDKVGVWLHAASAERLPDELLMRVEFLLGLSGADTLRYADPRAGQRRTISIARTADDTKVTAFLLAGDVRAAGWIGELLVEQLPADLYGRALLSGSAVAPMPVPARGAQVCSCFDVTEPQIEAALSRCDGAPEAQLAQLQSELRCGTNCGSCLPKLRSMVRKQAEVAA